jgi:hypothetical protein
MKGWGIVPSTELACRMRYHSHCNHFPVCPSVYLRAILAVRRRGVNRSVYSLHGHARTAHSADRSATARGT